MTDFVQAWQCIGCGSIEAPQTCIGVCEHHKVQFVYAAEHRRVTDELERTRREVAAARGFLHQLAYSHPHDDAWKSSYLRMQKHALRLLGKRTDADDQSPANTTPATHQTTALAR